MKNLVVFLLAISFTAFSWSCNGQKAEQPKSKKSSEQSISKSGVQVYYFHMTSRCVTCKTVEAEAKKDIELLYGKKVTFQSVNIEEDSNAPLAEKLKVNGQTLLVVKGNTRIDLTSEGFMYARSNPEKLKSIIKEKIDPLL